ncbi:MAG: hypothetical protein KBA53_05955 [Thermoclostridium sp.]|nr:hypothetical protein [Thermoclostridium sp.]
MKRIYSEDMSTDFSISWDFEADKGQAGMKAEQKCSPSLNMSLRKRLPCKEAIWFPWKFCFHKKEEHSERKTGLKLCFFISVVK